MSFDLDHLVERRQLKRKLSVWRIVAVLTLIILVAAASLSFVMDDSELSHKSDHIAKIVFAGTILGQDRKIKLIRQVAASDKVKGVIVSINSPGGATSGGEAIYEELQKLGKKKPVVASMDAMAASAGYMIALPTERIFARRTSITGSIGVLFQYTDITKLMDTVGVEMRSIKSAPLKAEPNPFSRRNPEAEAMIARMIDDSFQWFVDLVAENRPFDRARALELADGRVVTGGQALELQLVDELGGPEDAKNWLIQKHNLDKNLKIVEWKPEPISQSFPFGFASEMLSSWVPQPIIDLFAQRNSAVQLDGLVSVWQAQKNEQ
ncbi:signal peptide peptidase SppA [uncultured Cohaesibacter sp.]|uniref:signal peptide peptidase SppA n=1 Tax=uncultured Cohaesibacter sp. TaxID=1002546 RepID=UPI0029C8E93B|nr:signal peptide peptidase SppA [uncultured Cohaesibacter sp.]